MLFRLEYILEMQFFSFQALAFFVSIAMIVAQAGAVPTSVLYQECKGTISLK
jgi:hypothetical protein